MLGVRDEVKGHYIAKRLEVSGIVQGVGFRPFIYQLAKRHGIKGEVANTSSGVSVCIEGHGENIESFCNDVFQKSPPLSNVTNISIHREPIKSYKRFTIAKSVDNAEMATLISPDVSICDDCLSELLNPEDRRYEYPFINCTNCGPRYTIIDTIPYDRPGTSMEHFKMCNECQAEYDDPDNRRFHAQPNACHACGPHVLLYDKTRRKITVNDPIKKASELLRHGYILAIKGLGGFHLAVDAENNDAVISLRTKKAREQKPFALMSFTIDDVRKYAVVTQFLYVHPVILFSVPRSSFPSCKMLFDHKSTEL